MMDFNDLEMITYQILTETLKPLIYLRTLTRRITYFVDEFQDTNLLQWRIISKLVEEWISAMGQRQRQAGHTEFSLWGTETIYL